MDEAERRVAVARALLAGALAHDAHRGQVVDLVELPAALGHLVVDRVEVLRPADDVRGDVCLVQLVRENRRGLVGLRLAIRALVGDHRLDLRVLTRVQGLKREVLELPLQGVNPETMREGSVDLERLARLLGLLLPSEVLDRAHVVEAVGQLDEDHADVPRHGHDHLAVVLGLRLLPALEADSGELRDAFDELSDVGPELGSNLLEVGARVLDDVVEKRRRDRLLVQTELSADAGDAERVMDELLARPSHLPVVGPLGRLERSSQEVPVDIGVVRADLGDQLFDQVFVTSFGVEDAHVFQCTERSPCILLPRRRSARGGEVRLPMRPLKRWLRQRLARRLAVAMRDALVPSRPGLG